jgi:hypothetical protein
MAGGPLLGSYQMRIKVGSVAFLKAAGTGYGIGLDADGHRVEFIGDWRELADLPDPTGPEPVHVELENWQVLAVDGELRLPLNREALAERARFLRSALDQVRLPPTR